MRTRDIYDSLKENGIENGFNAIDYVSLIEPPKKFSIRGVVYSLAKQPQFAQDLIDKMARRLCDGKEALYVPVDHMTPEMQVWLQREDFEVDYDKRIHEYKINLL